MVSSLKTKVGWSNKEKLIARTMSNLTNQVGYINYISMLVDQTKKVC